MKYIALLRGINVGGKRRVPMVELRQCFINLGMQNVKTYINSGNVIFETSDQPLERLTKIIEEQLVRKFYFEIKCAVISAASLQKAILQAPSWWGDDTAGNKHNLIVAIKPKSVQEIIQVVGSIKSVYEQVATIDEFIFWTAAIKTFNKTQWSSITQKEVYQWITIRNANTARNLVNLTKDR